MNSESSRRIQKFVLPHSTSTTNRSRSKKKGQVNKAIIEAMVVNKTSMLKKTITDMNKSSAPPKVESKNYPMPPKSAAPTRQYLNTVETPTSGGTKTHLKNTRSKNILIDLSSPKNTNGGFSIASSGAGSTRSFLRSPLNCNSALSVAKQYNAHK